MTQDDDKKVGSLPPNDMSRLAQRDIGKVARLFRDSGFRYRVFDSETGEHQLVDPVRPLPPLDHVPPVWPPPFEEAEEPTRVQREVRHEPIAPPVAAVSQPSTATATATRAALRADARAEEIFRVAASGAGASSAAVKVEPALTRVAETVAPTPVPAAVASTRPQRQESPMRSNKPAPQPAVGGTAGRVVLFPAKSDTTATNDKAALRPFRGGGPTVATVIGKLLQPPVTPPKREPTSTGAVLRGILTPRSEN